jgi:hypothetical protein
MHLATLQGNVNATVFENHGAKCTWSATRQAAMIVKGTFR